MKHKESWGVIIASAVIDPIWWLFVVWIPIYLNEVYAMDVKAIGLYGWVPYVGAMLGAWFGGLLAQNRIKAGWTINKTRKLVITIGCMIMLPALLAMSNPGQPIFAVLIMAVILLGFQTAIGNVQTLPSDLFGKKNRWNFSGISGHGSKVRRCRAYCSHSALDLWRQLYTCFYHRGGFSSYRFSKYMDFMS